MKFLIALSVCLRVLIFDSSFYKKMFEEANELLTKQFKYVNE